VEFREDGECIVTDGGFCLFSLCLVLKIWRASRVKVETVTALNMSINSLAVLLL